MPKCHVWFSLEAEAACAGGELSSGDGAAGAGTDSSEGGAETPQRSWLAAPPRRGKPTHCHMCMCSVPGRWPCPGWRSQVML